MPSFDDRKSATGDDSDNILAHFDNLGARFARDYLNTYFAADVPTFDETLNMRFLAEHYKNLPPDTELLELGCGPTITHVLSAAPYVKRIHLMDYLQGCLDEIEMWRRKDVSSHSWTVFTKYALSVECQPQDEQSVQEREDLLRSKLASTSICNVRNMPPQEGLQPFSAVACFFTAEQATMAEEEMPHLERLKIWNGIMDNVCSCVSPGGLLLMGGVRDSDYYVTYDAQSGAPLFHPLPRTVEDDFVAALTRNGFDLSKSTIESADLEGQESEGLSGIILLAARKRS